MVTSNTYRPNLPIVTNIKNNKMLILSIPATTVKPSPISGTDDINNVHIPYFLYILIDFVKAFVLKGNHFLLLNLIKYPPKDQFRVAPRTLPTVAINNNNNI